MTEEQPPEQPQQFNIIAAPDKLAGVWANYANVTRSAYEFTIDFTRLDFAASQGVLVARVSMSPLFVMQLIDALQAVFRQYTDEAMPREVSGDGGGNAPGSDPNGAPDGP